MRRRNAEIENVDNQIQGLQGDAVGEEPAPNRAQSCWWAIVYSFLGIFTMTDAPQLAVVKHNFITNFLWKLRRSGYFHTFVLQGIVSTTYGVIKVIINFKFKGGSPYDTHNSFMVINNYALTVIIVAFMIMVFLVHNGDGSPPKGGYLIFQHVLNGVVMVAIVTVQYSLIMIAVIPPDKTQIGYIVLGVVSVGLSVFFMWWKGYLNSRSNQD